MARFASGAYTVKNPEKYIGKGTPKYRSGWEFHVMKTFDEHPNVEAWASESIRIPYRNPFTGKQTIYIPDFFVSFVDVNGKKRVEVIEVKPENQTFKEKAGRSKHNQAHWALNQVKWAVARNYCKQHGFHFRVIGEKDIYHMGGGKRK